MCGRFTLRHPESAVADLFGSGISVPETHPRYNIAPTQDVLSVRQTEGKRECVWMRWGLIPSWVRAEDDKSVALMNARAETLSTKPSFRESFKRRRCLIPADGFFEWKHERGKKLPYFIYKLGGEPLAFAGLWDRWEKDGETVESCTIITTEANDLVKSLHERMPVILSREKFEVWLDPRINRTGDLQKLLRPFPSKRLTMYPVSTVVNSGRVDGPRCVEPLRIVAEKRQLF